MLERVESWWRGFELCMLNAKNVWSCNKLLKFWIADVTDEFSSETLILRKRLSSLHTKCSQFLRWPSLLFCTCCAGEMMIPCQVSTFSEFICRAFQLQGHLAQNKSVNALKIVNYVRKGWKLTTSLWMLHTERKKVWSSNKFKKMKYPCNRRVLVRNLILRKRLSSLYTKCVQFLPWPSLLFRTCYAGEMLKLGMVSSFHPHSMCEIVERITAKTGCTSCTNWTISFGVLGFRTRTHRLHWHFIFLSLLQL